MDIERFDATNRMCDAVALDRMVWVSGQVPATLDAPIEQQTGEVLGRGAVQRDYRSPKDLFDRIAGTGRGAAPKGDAPGAPMAVQVAIPAGVNAIGIVGTRLEEWRASGRGAFDSPGRPIAIVSNVRVEYTPR